MDRADNNLLKETFKLFYEKHSAAFLNFIRKTCGGDSALANDIFQESFCRLFRSSPAGLNEYQLKAWLYKTAYRLIVDEKRRKRGDVLDGDMIMDESLSGSPQDLPIDMAEIFGQLKEKERTLLWMAHVEGYTHREISQIAGISEKSVKVVLFRLRKKFAGILKKSGFHGG
ncbi:MAG: sigma-70 family RNA polymerase sigma factor [Acidobacteriota bacterium]